MQSVFLEIFRSAAQSNPAKGTTKVWLPQFAYHRSFNRRHYLALRGLYGQPETPRETSNRAAFAGVESSRLVQGALGCTKPPHTAEFWNWPSMNCSDVSTTFIEEFLVIVRAEHRTAAQAQGYLDQMLPTPELPRVYESEAKYFTLAKSFQSQKWPYCSVS